MKQVVSTTPAELANMDPDVWYTIENAGPEVVYFDELAAAPTDPEPDDGFELLPGNALNWRSATAELRGRGAARVQRASDTEIYVWTSEGTSPVVYRPAT